MIGSLWWEATTLDALQREVQERSAPILLEMVLALAGTSSPEVFHQVVSRLFPFSSGGVQFGARLVIAPRIPEYRPGYTWTQYLVFVKRMIVRLPEEVKDLPAPLPGWQDSPRHREKPSWAFFFPSWLEWGAVPTIEMTARLLPARIQGEEERHLAANSWLLKMWEGVVHQTQLLFQLVLMQSPVEEIEQRCHRYGYRLTPAWRSALQQPNRVLLW